MGYIISATDENTRIDYPRQRYMGYSKREAIARYKEKHGLKGKRNITVCVIKTHFI